MPLTTVECSFDRVFLQETCPLKSQMQQMNKIFYDYAKSGGVKIFCHNSLASIVTVCKLNY